MIQNRPKLTINNLVTPCIIVRTRSKHEKHISLLVLILELRVNVFKRSIFNHHKNIKELNFIHLYAHDPFTK